MERLRASVVVACALVVAACSRDDEPPPTVALKRPLAARAEFVLRPVARGDYVAPPGRELAVTNALAAWQIDGGTPRIEGDQLRITPVAADVRIRIPGPHDLKRFGSLSLRVHGPFAPRLTIELAAPSSSDEKLGSVALPAAEYASSEWTVLRGALSANADVPYVDIVFRGELGTELVLDSFVLEWSPATAWNPLLAQSTTGGAIGVKQVPAPFPLQIATECRPSIGLLPAHLLRGSARVAAAGSKLAFGYAAIDPFRGKPTKVELRATLRGEHGFERTAELDIPSTARWREFECDIDAQPGELVTLECELVVRGSGSACVAIATPRLFVPEPVPQTVVLITSDTHRGDHLGLARQGVEVATPALDALASHGLLFSDCFAATNITIPSHVAILTGTHPLDSGLIGNNMTLAAEPTTLAEAFRAAGYATMAVTSINLLSSKIAGVDRGFDRISWPAASRDSRRAVDLALEWLDEARDRPVFLWLHVFDAHAPYQPPQREESSARDDAAPAGEGDAPLADDDGKARIPAWAGPNCDVSCIRGLYRGEVAHVDEQLARVFAHERLANAVVAFTGDHGEVLGLHGIYWAHKALYPDTLHVPLILAWPGAPAGERIDAPATNVDLGRTLLDLAGLVDAPFPGRDLVSGARSTRLRDTPRFGIEGRAHSASITWEGWHLLLQLEELPEHERHENKAVHQVALYRLTDDPACERDLTSERFEKARELRKHLVRWLGGWKGERWVGAVRQDAETLRELAALGYAAESGAALGDRPLFDVSCTCAWCAKFR